MDGDTGRLSFQLPELSVAATFRHRLPWSAEYPNSAGPEGWLQRTGLLPTHYFVVREPRWVEILGFVTPVRRQCVEKCRLLLYSVN